jgi:hypothetical protein
MTKNKSNLVLLKINPSQCSECGWNHDPEIPHNKNSPFYQAKFSDENHREPTWEDAMAHCSEERKQWWRDSMKKTQEIGKKLGIPRL